MKTRHSPIAAAFVLVVVCNAQAGSFTLTGVEHLDVTSGYYEGTLYDSSTASVLTGGRVTHLKVYDTSSAAILTSSVPISSARVRDIYMYNNSSVVINDHSEQDRSGGGGEIYNVFSLYAADTSNVTITKGDINWLSAANSSEVIMSGGAVGGPMEASLNVHDEARLTLTGGYVVRLGAWDSSRIVIDGGAVGRMHARDSSEVIMSGGAVGTSMAEAMDVSGEARLTLTGGSVAELGAWDSSRIVIDGGAVGRMSAHHSSSITFHGTDFQVSGGLSLDGETVLGTGLLTGKWFDGTAFSMPISNHGPDATIRVIPEPATLALLAFGGLAIVRRRRR